MFPENEFLDFLIKAKKETYASQGDDASVPPVMKGSRQLEYRDGEFFYRDIYFGMSYFIGQETVYYKGNPIWSMSYSGGVDSRHEIDFVKQVYAVLRKAMCKVSIDNPYRGPKEFHSGDYLYKDQNQGDIGQFVGKEMVFYDNNQVYTLHYSGGFIR